MENFISDLKCSINKFSLSQMTSNSDGKTSSTGTMGCLTIGVGLLAFLVGVLDSILWTKTTNVMLQSLALIGAGHTMLMYRKSKDAKVIKPETEVEPEPEPEVK